MSQPTAFVTEKPPEVEESELLFCIRLVKALLISQGGPLLRRASEPPANHPPQRKPKPSHAT
jgi:hypothetical protein